MSFEYFLNPNAAMNITENESKIIRILTENNKKTLTRVVGDSNYYRIDDEDLEPLIFLGETMSTESEFNVIMELLDYGIIPVTFRSDDEGYIIAISAQQINLIKPLLSYLYENLKVSDYDLPELFDYLTNHFYDMVHDELNRESFTFYEYIYRDTVCQNTDNIDLYVLFNEKFDYLY